MDKNWDEIEVKAMEYTEDNMRNRGMNCAESVFEALIRSGAVDVPVEAAAYATGFGGGGGGVGFTCGALASAILANSIVHGRKYPESADRTVLKQRFYMRYNNLVSDFVKVAGSGLCREIVNAFPGGYKDPDTRSNCIRISVEAARLAVDYLRRDAEEAALLEYDPDVVGTNNWF